MIFMISLGLGVCAHILHAPLSHHNSPPSNGSSTSQYNRTQVNAESASHGLKSPYNVFLEDQNGLIYFTDVKVQSLSGTTKFRVAIDINQPFTFLTELQAPSTAIHLTKMHISQSQTNLIIQYMKPKFNEIADYANDIYYVVNSSFWVNDMIQTDFSFFYLTGYGAAVFQYQTTLEGYLGAGVNHFASEPSSLNIVISLFESYILNDSSFSLYLGNEPGYIDSIFFLGGYQKMFLQQDSFSQVKVISDREELWQLKIASLHLSFGGSVFYYSQRSLRSKISSYYPFIQVPRDVAKAIQSQIEKDGSIVCDYRNQLVQSINASLLQCSSKMPVVESLKCPQVLMEVERSEEGEGGKSIVLELGPQDYIQKCLYDVENYAQVCITNLAVSDDQEMDMILGLPFLRTYYTFYQLQNSSLMLAKAYSVRQQPEYSQFWYYSLITLLIIWALLMMSCGIYFKNVMNNFIIVIHHLLRYALGNRESRFFLIRFFLLAEDDDRE